jgi:hypothetical protein
VPVLRKNARLGVPSNIFERDLVERSIPASAFDQRRLGVFSPHKNADALYDARLRVSI